MQQTNPAAVGEYLRGLQQSIVAAVERADGGLHVTITRDYPGNQPYVTVIAVSAEGLFRVSSNGKALGTPIQLFKSPPKVGATWKSGDVGFKIVGEEEVEVPAGKYKAFKVESPDSGAPNTVLWFAPGVGLVKQTNASSETSVVLKAFTPGK